MPYYETVFIARQELTETQVKKMTEDFSKILKDNGGKIHKEEQWGLRSLAYKIKKNKKGHYTLIESEASGEAVIEMERQMRLHEDVLRYLTIREEKLSEGPSKIMQKDSSDSYSNRDSNKEEAA